MVQPLSTSGWNFHETRIQASWGIQTSVWCYAGSARRWLDLDGFRQPNVHNCNIRVLKVSIQRQCGHWTSFGSLGISSAALCPVCSFMICFGRSPICVNLAHSFVNNSSISSSLDDPITRFTKMEISACRSWSCSTASLHIPSNRWSITGFNLIEILSLRIESPSLFATGLSFNTTRQTSLCSGSLLPYRISGSVSSHLTRHIFSLIDNTF